MQSNKLGGIQVMRGVAAMLVFFFHLDIFIPGNSILNSLFSPGFKGVYIFFVVSGYIMAYTTRLVTGDKLNAAGHFFTKRLIRIVPLYYVATAAVMVLMHTAHLYFWERPDLLVKSLAFIPTFEPEVAPNYGDPVLFLGWTLNYEMLFYLLFAIGILLGRYRNTFLYCYFPFFVIILPLFTLGTVTFDVHGYNFTSNALKFLSNPILLYFVAGVLLANTISQAKVTGRTAWIIFAMSFMLFLLSYFELLPLPQSLSEFIFITLLVASASILPNVGEGRVSRILTYLGDISYSVYLFHMIVIFIVRGFFNKFGLADSVDPWMIQALCLIGTVLVAAVSYEVIERRLTSFLREKFLPTAKALAK